MSEASQMEFVLDGGECQDSPSPSSPDTPSQRSVVLSVRMTQAEHEALQAMAGSVALGAFVRRRLFGDEGVVDEPFCYARHRGRGRVLRAPKAESVEIARLLGMLGQSEWATRLLALSMAVENGVLPVSPETERTITQACEDMAEMKALLIVALGVKPQGQEQAVRP